MKNYWGNWILFGSAIIFVCITVLSTCTTLVEARRIRSSRHRKPKHSESEDYLPTTPSSTSSFNDTSSSSTLPPLGLHKKSEKWRMEQFDVCQGWWCGHGRECQRGTDGLPSCICMRQCPDKPPTTDQNREGNSNKNGYLEYGKGFEEFYEPFPDSELIFPPDAIAVRLNEYKPVCGTDGKIYPNHCELYRSACITNQPYLHVDESEQSCRHVASGGSGAGGVGDEKEIHGAPSHPPSGGRDGGRRNGGGRGHGEGNGAGSRGGGAGSHGQNNPFGDGPSFLGPGGDFPQFPQEDIPSFGDAEGPYGPAGGGFGGGSDVPGNQNGAGGPEEVDKFKPQSGKNNGKPGRHNDKEKAGDGQRNRGKLSDKSTGFGSPAYEAAAAAAPRKWVLSESSASLKNHLFSNLRSDAEDDDSEEDEEEEEDDEDEDLSDEDDDDVEDDDYSGELDNYSFLDDSKLSLLEDSGAADAAKRASPLSSRQISSNKHNNNNNMANNLKKPIMKTDEGDDDDIYESENGKMKMTKVKKSKRGKVVEKKGIMEPTQVRWDDDGSTTDEAGNGPVATPTRNNLAHDQEKSNSHWHKEDASSWKMDFINKKKSAFRSAPAARRTDSESYFTPSSHPAVQQNEHENNAGMQQDSPGVAQGISSGTSGITMTSKSMKSEGKTFLSNARRGSSLCSREEYEILKNALLIYNHQHLIEDTRFSKRRKEQQHTTTNNNKKKLVNRRGRRGARAGKKNDEYDDSSDEDDEDEDGSTMVDDADDNDVVDDSNEDEDYDGKRRATAGRQYEDESTFEKEYLLSLMFAHFDQNNNGKLDYAELQKVGLEQKIERPATIHCHLVDFLRFDDMDHDSLISPNEFYAAFSKLYSMSILGIGKPRAPIYLTARVGESLEIKCSVGAGSVSSIPLGGGQKRRKYRTIPNSPGSTGNDDDSNNDNIDDVDDDYNHAGNERERDDEEDYNSPGFSVDLDDDDEDDDGTTITNNNNKGNDGRKRNSRKAPSSSSSPELPTTQWYRYGVDVSKLINLGEQFQIHKDGTLLINRVELIHSGNYSCHDDGGNEKVIQPYVLAVQMAPDVKVRPHIKWERPGQDVSMECRAQGEPLPTVHWLKNDNPVIPSKNKFAITGDGITLKVKDINFSDTGAYMCQAQNEAGKRIDISSLVVIDEQALPPVQYNESQFFVFHERGISTYDPENCRLQHQILATDIIPGTQRDYICGSAMPSSCEWGRGIRVSSVYVYASQPKLNRVLIISISQMVVVDVVSTDRLPVELHYVPQVDQVWIECWREEEPYTSKTLQVIRGAKEKKKHRAVRPKPLVSLEADLVQNVFLPPAESPFISLPSASATPSPSFWHAYISHKNTRGLYKMDLRTLRYTKSIDLTSYNCLPEQVHFTALYGFIILECKEPVLHQPTGQLVLDSISDAIISYKADLNGASFLSPDSRKLVTMVQNRHDHSSGTKLLLQHLEASGLRIAFDVNTSLNISDVAFFPSQRFHGYDLYATAVDKEDVLFVDLHSGNVELVPGVGRALENPSWERAQRPIASDQNLFGKYLVTPSSDAVYVVNGRSHTVNCQVGGMTKPNMVVWL